MTRAFSTLDLVLVLAILAVASFVIRGLLAHTWADDEVRREMHEARAEAAYQEERAVMLDDTATACVDVARVALDHWGACLAREEHALVRGWGR